MVKKRGSVSRNNKKGQEIFGLSFGMIFAIILIVFFIVVAFIAIKHFWDLKNCSMTGMFIGDFQDEVEATWRANDQNTTFQGFLPTGIKKVCFVNVTNSQNGPDKNLSDDFNYDPLQNMYLIPMNKACDMAENKVKYIDVNYITRRYNPYCIDVVNGKVSMLIEKEPNERLVKIK